MTMTQEHVLRNEFLFWAAHQSRPPALALPEVTVGGKRLDLVCLEGPLTNVEFPKSFKQYLPLSWDRICEGSVPLADATDMIQGSGLNGRGKRRLIRELSGRKAWIVELTNRLSFRAFGQISAYRSLFVPAFPGLSVARSLIACRRTDSPIERVCNAQRIEVVVLDA